MVSYISDNGQIQLIQYWSCLQQYITFVVYYLRIVELMVVYRDKVLVLNVFLPGNMVAFPIQNETKSQRYSLEVAAHGLLSQYLINKVRILSQRPAESNHVDVPTSDSLRHAMTIAPASCSPNDRTRLDSELDGVLKLSIKSTHENLLKLLGPFNKVTSSNQFLVFW